MFGGLDFKNLNLMGKQKQQPQQTQEPQKGITDMFAGLKKNGP